MSKFLLQKLYFPMRKATRSVLNLFRPHLSVVLLSWNRPFLLRQTVYSLLANSRKVSEIIIVDNGSSAEASDWLKEFSETHAIVKLIQLNQNIGGEAINKGLMIAKGQFIFISENDLEFKFGWDVEMLRYFKNHPNLGQLSPFSPFPEESKGEVWGIKKFIKTQISGHEYFLAEQNVGTSSMIRRQVIDSGIRMGSICTPNSDLKFPSDAQFSNDIKLAGYDVAWANKYMVTNWGHNESIWKAFPEYFSKNFSSKQFHGMDGLSKINLSTETLMQKNESLNKKLRHIKSLGIIPSYEWEQINFFEETTLYLDLGNGFQEHTKIQTDLKVFDSKIAVSFKVSEKEKIYNFRWDPWEGSGCCLRDLQIKILDAANRKTSVVAWKSNGILENGNEIKFVTADPFITFENNTDSPVYVEIYASISIGSKN